jgi:hypothetical protein
MLVGLEYDAAIEEGSECPDLVLFGASGVAVYFELPAPFVAPLLVEVNNEIQTSMVAGGAVVIEVDMGIELLSVFVIMCAASVIIWVIDQVRDACNFGDVIEERFGRNESVERLVERGVRSDLFERGFAAHMPMFVDSALFIENGKLTQKPLGNLFSQKTVDRYVLEGRRCQKFFAQCRACRELGI